MEQPASTQDTSTSGHTGTAPKRPSAIRLRPLEPKDADAIFDICRKAHEKTPAKVFAFSRKRFDGHLSSYFSRKGTQATVIAEIDGRVVGFVWVKCGVFTYSDSDKIATIMTLNVDHEGTGPFSRARVFLTLISAAKALAEQWGALQTTIHTTTGDQAENADRLLKRSGANLIGGNYVL